MEAKNNVNFIGKYFGKEGRFANFVLRSALVLVIAQQIYFPQEMKYFHLAVLFMYMIFLEFFKDDRRAFYEEYALVASVLACSLISVIEVVVSFKLSIFYLVSLMAAIYLGFVLVNRIFNIVRMESDFSMFTEANQKMLEKGTMFIKVLTGSIMAILLITSIYVVYQFIQLF